jgi:hypothetical protein
MNFTLPVKIHSLFQKLALPCAIIISAMWWVSSVAKFQNLASFYLSVSDLSPIGWVGFNVAVAHFVPSLELVLAMGVLLPYTRREALQVSAGLLGLFCVLLLRAALQKIEAECGCFGPNFGPSSHMVGVIRNVILIVIALIPGIPWKPRENV